MAVFQVAPYFLIPGNHTLLITVAANSQTRQSGKCIASFLILFLPLPSARAYLPCAMALAMRPFQQNHTSSDDDPLALVLQPPPDESPADRARREQQQREATRVSLEIDEGIQEAKKLYERRKKAVKILLLGE